MSELRLWPQSPFQLNCSSFIWFSFWWGSWLPDCPTHLHATHDIAGENDISYYPYEIHPKVIWLMTVDCGCSDSHECPSGELLSSCQSRNQITCLLRWKQMPSEHSWAPLPPGRPPQTQGAPCLCLCPMSPIDHWLKVSPYSLHCLA